MKRSANLPRSRSRQRGGAAVLSLFLIGAGVALIAYSSDGARITADAAQLKRGTDAAAMAVASARLQASNPPSAQALQDMAQRYVRANLGLDSEQIDQGLTVNVQDITHAAGIGTRVTAAFQAQPAIAGAMAQAVSVSSTAVARIHPVEVALALPNGANYAFDNATQTDDQNNDRHIEAIRGLAKGFMHELLDQNDQALLALVPYSNTVNVHDSRDPDRINRWVRRSALRPAPLVPMLDGLKLYRLNNQNRTPGVGLPDRIANLLCLSRGTNRGQAYFWDRPPGDFSIHYLVDEGVDNGSPGAPALRWSSAASTFFLVADRGCPHAALMPLTRDTQRLSQRLDAMRTQNGTNFTIAIGWSAMALAPAFSGQTGWGGSQNVPREFDDGSGSVQKAIVLLASSNILTDGDSYNRDPEFGGAIDGVEPGNRNWNQVITTRLKELCKSVRSRDIAFYAVVTGHDNTRFKNVIKPGLDVCTAQDNGRQYYFSGIDFHAARADVKQSLEEIAAELRRRSSTIRLVE